MKREPIIQMFSIFTALIFVVFASGCISVGPTVRTYSGDKLQKSEVAVIKGWWTFALLGYEGLDIYALDGNNLRATKVEVLPGKHSLTIRWYHFGFTLLPPFEQYERYTEAEFNFEAGHKYKIKYRYEKGILIEGVKIIDVTTGAIIWESSLSS